MSVVFRSNPTTLTIVVGAVVTALVLAPGCSNSGRYTPCSHGAGCPVDEVCSEASHVCVTFCELAGDCAPDELCSNNYSCEPAGTTPAGASCVGQFVCVAGYFCCPSRQIDRGPGLSLDETRDYQCRPVCPQPLTEPPAHPSRLQPPADDSACPSGLVCVYQPFDGLRQQNVCVPPCDPADASTCLPDSVCRYRECIANFLAAACPDGTMCAVGEICDGATAPDGCVTPVAFDAAHTRPGWPR